jgi:hypothetical protein
LKKRKKKIRQKSRNAHSARLNGFDFGLDQMAMAVSDFQFSNLLHEAEVGACAYGVGYSSDAKASVPFISLAASKIDPLKAALEILQRWDRGPGDDGFSLDFILRRDGGYLLAVSPDFKALLYRINRSDRFFSQFGMTISWMKDFPARGPWLADFRKYVARRAAPFVFTGCQWAPREQAARHVSGLSEILKFEACFSEEGATTQGTFGDAMLELHRQGKVKARRSFPARPIQTREAIRERRADQLRRHFPVTLWKDRADPSFEAFRSRNLDLNIQRWQWEQALCNTLLSTELTAGPHYPNFNGHQLISAIAQRLLDRIELVGAISEPVIDDQTLIKQISLDSGYLLENRGCREIPNDHAQLQNRLTYEGLL